VAQGVPEAGLEGLDHEPRAELGDGLFRQSGSLCNEHGLFPFGESARHMALTEDQRVARPPLLSCKNWGARRPGPPTDRRSPVRALHAAALRRANAVV